MSFCPQCGKETLPGASFCVGCGASLQAISVDSPTILISTETNVVNSTQGDIHDDKPRAINAKSGDFRSPGEIAREKAEAARRPDDWEEFIPDLKAEVQSSLPVENKISYSDPTSPIPAEEIQGKEIPSAPILCDTNPFFFNIPTPLLIVLSILTAGIYDRYWIYKNLEYLRQKNGLNISPLGRAILGPWYMRDTFTAIRDDPRARMIAEPRYKGTALGWTYLVLKLMAFKAKGDDVIILTIISLVGGVLCMLPAQNYIRSVNRMKNENTQMSPIAVGTMVCISLGICSWLLFFANPFGKLLKRPVSLHDQLVQICKTTNSEGPILIDQETRLDGIRVTPDNVVVYTMSAFQRDLRGKDTRAGMALVRNQLIANYRSNKDLEFFRQNKVVLRYDYFDKNHYNFATVQITPADLSLNP
jgi:hypothetical protein